MRLKLRVPKPGVRGWIGVGALVVAADLLDGRTMSDVSREVCRHPVAGPPVMAAWLYLTAHLFGLLPPEYDLLHQAGKRFPRGNGRISP